MTYKEKMKSCKARLVGADGQANPVENLSGQLKVRPLHVPLHGPWAGAIIGTASVVYIGRQMLKAGDTGAPTFLTDMILESYKRLP
jgi:hypothetical protein